KLNLSSRVTLLGSLSQAGVFEKLQAGDIFALPSVTDRQGASDVFPTVIMEAMSAARPVVSTRLAGIPELVVHEETGFLVQPGDTAGVFTDAMVMEAEWRANSALTQKLEEQRAQETERVPEGIFLRQARFAIVLRRLLLEKNVSHIHATTSRALVCALILQEFVNVTVSATIERRPELPQNWIRSALHRCEGGRLSDHKILRSYDDSFLRDKAA